jgi:hypothetical protein
VNPLPSPADIAGIKGYLATSYAMKDGLLAAKDGKSARTADSIEQKAAGRKRKAEVRGWTWAMAEAAGRNGLAAFLIRESSRRFPMGS